MDQWDAFKQYELQQRQQRLANEQRLAEEQERKKKETETLLSSISEQTQTLLKNNRRILSLVSQQQAEKAREEFFAQEAEELRRRDAERNESLRLVSQMVQEQQKPQIWTSRDGREFRSPREAEFWDAWIADAGRAETISLVPQYKIGRYRIDFAHLASKTAIELDGHGFHSDRYTFTKDRVRQREIEKQGWRFIRFSADEISADVEGRVREVYDFIRGR